MLLRLSRLRQHCVSLLCLFLIGCSAAAAQPEPATPTPLPPAPELERPTYTVERGSIERVLEASGRITPVDLVRLPFSADGRVAEVRVVRGAPVQAGDVLATLNQTAELAAREQADLAVVSAERDLAAARTQRDLGITQAAGRLAAARERLERLLAGPGVQERRQAEDALADAQRTLETTRRTAAAAKVEAERAVAAAVDALVAAQDVYSDAYWAAQQARSGPLEQPTLDALAEAERDLRAAERERAQALLALDEAGRAEVEQIQAAESQLARAERDLRQLDQVYLEAETVATARQAVAEARLSLHAAQQATFAREQNALDAARLDREQAERAVVAGQIIAPQAGQVVAVSIRPGDEVTAFTPVIEIANPATLEVAAELAAEQLRELAEGQPAEVRLLSRPDLALPAVIRRLPIGGSGTVRADDRSTRLEITDLRGQTLTLGAVTRVQIVLEQKANVLLLPPEAIRAFEGRRFVIVREAERERRVPVRIGVETPERVEVLEGVQAGDLVLGP